MSRLRKGPLVLAIHPSWRGIAWVTFEGPLSPVDWGAKQVRRQTDGRLFDAVVQIIERHEPDILVIEDCTSPRARRSEKVRRFLRLTASHATGYAIEVHRFSRGAIQKCFQSLGAKTKYQIAQVIASRIAMFGHRLPPVPKPWLKDHSRMGLFVAASLAMTFYSRNRKEPFEKLPPEF